MYNLTENLALYLANFRDIALASYHFVTSINYGNQILFTCSEFLLEFRMVDFIFVAHFIA